MAEVRAEMDAAKNLKVGTGEFDLLAGVDQAFSGHLNAFARAQLEWHPLENVTGSTFVQADLDGVTAGVGLKVDF